MTLNYIWNIPWQEMEVVLNQKNTYSLRGLSLDSREKAQNFLKACGFDPADPSDCRALNQLFGEALFFIRHMLLNAQERERLTVPSEILNFENPEELLLIQASNLKPKKRYVRLWSCALLKVMYSIANVQYSERFHSLGIARETIFKSIKNILSTENEQYKIFFHKNSLSLKKIEWKEQKTRSSIIMKLLHKPESIVDEVFDYLGVRFVVEGSKEISLLLKILIEANIIIPHQVVAVRTRNSLLNIKSPKKIITFLKELLSIGTLTNTEFENMCQKIPWSSSAGEETKRQNSFSSSQYKSLQLTVRHLIKSSSPFYSVLESLTSQLHRYTGLGRNEPWLDSIVPRFQSNYFPIEIQIMDEQSYEAAKFGPASHEQYKASQLKMVRERVLGNLLHFTKEKLERQDF